MTSFGREAFARNDSLPTRQCADITRRKPSRLHWAPETLASQWFVETGSYLIRILHLRYIRCACELNPQCRCFSLKDDPLEVFDNMCIVSDDYQPLVSVHKRPTGQYRVKLLACV